jgi:TRAP transporter TAXI family solute receptor
MKPIHKLLLVLIPIAVIVQVWFIYADRNQVTQISIAASSRGDAFKMAQAIATVITNTHPDLRINVEPSSGSVESMQLLELGNVDLAMVQADTDASDNARLVSVLYHDLFQLFVRNDADIEDISGLLGKRIAIAKQTSGQYASFWALMQHYGIDKNNITALSMGQEEADEAFVQGKVDAVFRIAPPGATSIKELNEKVPIKLLAISQAKAIRLTEPSLQAGIIPQGSYRGFPAVPITDIPTVASDRLLIARNTASAEIVKKITEVLFENQQDLQKQIKLAGFISQPDMEKGTAIPVHTGAKEFYNRESPGFIEKYAESIALVLTLLAIPFSGVMQLRQKAQQRRVKQYNAQLLDYIKQAENVHDQQQLEIMYHEINKILTEAIHDRNNDKISAEDFDFFSFLWSTAKEEVLEALHSVTKH